MLRVVAADDPPRCARCLDLEDELTELRQQLAAVGRYVVYSPGPNTNPSLYINYRAQPVPRQMAHSRQQIRAHARPNQYMDRQTKLAFGR